MPSNPQPYDDRDLPKGKSPPGERDLSNPSRSHSPNSSNHESKNTGSGRVARDDQRQNSG